MTTTEFVDELASISLPGVFNPYRDICTIADDRESPKLRRQNLELYLCAILCAKVRSIWVGRDLGYRGGRRTGIALTDEYHLNAFETTFGIAGVVKATADDSVTKERTATEVWKLLGKVNEPVLLWNAFPFHPFVAGEPFSNRRHTSSEFQACRHILVMLFEWVRPTNVVALGADAEASVLSIGYKCERVRHPSYGGQNEFAKAVKSIYADDFCV